MEARVAEAVATAIRFWNWLPLSSEELKEATGRGRAGDKDAPARVAWLISQAGRDDEDDDRTAWPSWDDDTDGMKPDPSGAVENKAKPTVLEKIIEVRRKLQFVYYKYLYVSYQTIEIITHY